MSQAVYLVGFISLLASAVIWLVQCVYTLYDCLASVPKLYSDSLLMLDDPC